MEKNDLTEILNFINPSELTYSEWCAVGMALKLEGYPSCEREDSRRFEQYIAGTVQDNPAV